MEYRELGRTGIKVSVIALGCEGFVANEGALTDLFYRHIYVRFGRRDSISGPGRSGK